MFVTLLQNDSVGFDESKDYGMGEPSIRVGDSVIFVRHIRQSLWLGHQVQESSLWLVVVIPHLTAALV